MPSSSTQKVLEHKGPVAIQFFIMTFLSGVSLALATILYVRHNYEEADELAQCIVFSDWRISTLVSLANIFKSPSKVGISIPIFFTCGILVLSIKPNQHGIVKIKISMLSDSLFIISS